MKSKIIKQELIEWRKLEIIQGENFKEISIQSFDKLKKSLKENSFVQPFNVWESGKKLYCLDGYHRKKALLDLKKEGVEIPDKLPANFIDCKDKKEASKLVLVYSSIYANVTDEGLYEFLNVNELDFDSLKLELDLPEINLEQFEAGYLKDCDPTNKEKEVGELETEHECPKCGYKW